MYSSSPGLSATFEGQLKKILDTLTVAVQQVSPTKSMSNVSPEGIMKKIEATLEEKAHKAEQEEQASSCGNDASTQHFGSKLKAMAKPKKEKRKEANKWCDPDDIPVIVLDGFMSREKGPHTKELWTFLAEWAAILAENHIAHVVFISNNVAAPKVLVKGMSPC